MGNLNMLTKLKRRLFLTICIFSVLSMNLYALESNWPSLSRELNSEDINVSISAEQSLRKIPNLSSILIKGLKKEDTKSSALLVIRKLKISEAVSEVIELGKTQPDWEIFQTLQALSSGTEKAPIILFFRNILEAKEGSQNPVSLIACLSTFQEVNEKISHEHLLKLLEHESFEVRMSTINFAAQSWLNGERSFDVLFHRALQSHPYQLRESALLWLKEANKDIKKDFSSDLMSFDKEKNLTVKNLAFQILKSVSKE